MSVTAGVIYKNLRPCSEGAKKRLCKNGTNRNNVIP